MGEILRTLALHPLDALARLLRALQAHDAARSCFLPLGLLPLLGWRALLVALPSLAYTYLSAPPKPVRHPLPILLPALGWLVVASGAGGSASGWVSGQRFTAACSAPGPVAERRRSCRWRVAVVATSVIDAYRKPITAELLQAPPVPRGARDPPPRHRTRGVAFGDQPAGAPFAHRREYFLALDFTRSTVSSTPRSGSRTTVTPPFHLFDLTAPRPQPGPRATGRLSFLADTRYGIRYYRFPLVLFERGLARRQLSWRPDHRGWR